MHLNPYFLFRSKPYRRILCAILLIPLLVGWAPNACIQVTAKEKENYDSIDLKQKLLIARVGDKYELDCSGVYNAIVLGSPIQWYEDISNVTWKSNDTKVATVSKKGVITAVKSGKCTITASWGKLKSQCKVRVYTEKELYDHVLDADIAHENLFMAMTTAYYKNYDLLYDSEGFKEVAAKKVEAAKKAKKIIDSIITEDMSDYQKMLTVAEWIYDNIEVIRNYRSKFTKEWIMSYDKAYYYLDPLLYGKSNHRGTGLLFELLMNLSGIRCELMYNDGDFATDDGEGAKVSDCNIVELDGDYYYFDLIGLIYDRQDSMEETGKKPSFYELLASENDAVYQFVHITTSDKTYVNQYETSPRDTNYGSDMEYDMSLMADLDSDKSFTYSHYFYDFYNDSIRFVTLKEYQKNQHFNDRPYFSSLPGYPDSPSSKYKEVMNREAGFNSKVLQLLGSVEEILQMEAEGIPTSPEEIALLADNLTGLEAEYEGLKSTLTLKNMAIYLQNKMDEAKHKLAELQTN